MIRTFTPALRAGLAGGSLLYLHGLFPDTHAYPLVWPLLAGAVALWLATGEPARRPRWRGLATASVAGVLAGVLAFVAFSVTLLALRQPVLASTARALGASGPLPSPQTVIPALALVVAMAIPAALLGGLLTLPLRWVWPARSGPRAV